MKRLTALKTWWSLLMDWLATPFIWLFWPIRTRWLGRNIANLISLARLPLMIWILTKLVDADPWQTLRLVLLVGAVQVLDGLDGAVARGLNASGPTGGAIDGGVDKINTLLFVGTLIGQLLQGDANQALIILSCIILLAVIFLQVGTIRINNQRRQITDARHQSFGSRLPAQVNFIASMLIIAICWVIPSEAATAWALFFGADLMLFLSAWTLADYNEDLIQLQLENYPA